MANCPHCGSEIQDGDEVCWNCGGTIVAGGSGEPQRGQGQPGQGQPQDQYGQDQPQGQYRQDQPQGQYRQDQPQGQYGQDQPQGQYRQDQPQGQYRQPQQVDSGGVSRRQLLAGGGIAAVVAAGGGWYFFLREDLPSSPETPGELFDSAPEVPEGTHGTYESTDGEADYFAVELDEGQQLTATIEFQHAEGDLDLALHGPDRQELRSSASMSDDETASIVADQGGTYYIRVYGFGGATNEYELDVQIGQPSDTGGTGESTGTGAGTGSGTPQREFENATAISEGRHGPYEITGGEDQYYAVELDEGQQLTATIYFAHAEGDLDLALHGPDTQELRSSTSMSDNESISVVASQGGTYYIRAYGFGGATNEYELEVQID